MRILKRGSVLSRSGNLAAALLSFLILAASGSGGQATSPAPDQQTPGAQTPGTQNGGPPNEPARRGGFVPGQKREAGDPVQIARGKTLYAINCRGCHGADLRGGDLGGPNLLRSQVALSDLHGELIVPIIHGARKSMGMPAIGLNDADANAAAAYVRSVVETIEGQGAPPSAGQQTPSILVGNAEEGKSFFAAKCSSCHSASGDLKGIAARVPDPKRLQNTWVSGGSHDEEERSVSGSQPAKATVTLPSGESVEGNLVRIDDFIVTLQVADGSQRTFRRSGDVPAVVIRDSMQAHRDLLSQYSNKDIHDVTAYLVTLK